MSRFGNPSEPRPSKLLLAAALSLLASACPFSDSYEIDNGGEGGNEGGAGGGGVSPIGPTVTSTTTVGGAGGESCDTPSAPPGGACPPECDSCVGATCIFECADMPGQKCDADTLACPAGFACQVHCDGKDACKDASVMCPLGYGCHVSCDGDDSCKGTTIVCGGGECAVECNSPQACKEADFGCGAQGFCACNGFAQPLQTTGCETACSCTGCE